MNLVLRKENKSYLAQLCDYVATNLSVFDRRILEHKHFVLKFL